MKAEFNRVWGRAGQPLIIVVSPNAVDRTAIRRVWDAANAGPPPPAATTPVLAPPPPVLAPPPPVEPAPPPPPATDPLGQAGLIDFGAVSKVVQSKLA